MGEEVLEEAPAEEGDDSINKPDDAEDVSEEDVEDADELEEDEE